MAVGITAAGSTSNTRSGFEQSPSHGPGDSSHGTGSSS